MQFTADDMNRSFVVTGWIELLDFTTFDHSRIGSFARTQKTQKMVSKLAFDLHKSNIKLANAGLFNLGNADGTTPTI